MTTTKLTLTEHQCVYPTTPTGGTWACVDCGTPLPAPFAPRLCATGCGLAATPGDRYCGGCGSADDRTGWTS